MCFRPAGVDMPDPICPECGKKLTIIGGVVMKTCPFCKADLTKYAEQAGFAPPPGAPSAPKAPGVPGASGPPKAPGAPGVPGVPKAPGMPNAPKAPGPRQ